MENADWRKEFSSYMPVTWLLHALKLPAETVIMLQGAEKLYTGSGYMRDADLLNGGYSWKYQAATRAGSFCEVAHSLHFVI